MRCSKLEFVVAESCKFVCLFVCSLVRLFSSSLPSVLPSLLSKKDVAPNLNKNRICFLVVSKRGNDEIDLVVNLMFSFPLLYKLQPERSDFELTK